MQTKNQQEGHLLKSVHRYTGRAVSRNLKKALHIHSTTKETLQFYQSSSNSDWFCVCSNKTAPGECEVTNIGHAFRE